MTLIAHDYLRLKYSYHRIKRLLSAMAPRLEHI